MDEKEAALFAKAYEFLLTEARLASAGAKADHIKIAVQYGEGNRKTYRIER